MSNIEQRTFFQKISKDPVPAIGMAGFFGVVGYALWNIRKKDASTKTSVYLIHTRVAAQGFVISLLTLSVAYHMVQSFRNPAVFPAEPVKPPMNAPLHHPSSHPIRYEINKPHD